MTIMENGRQLEIATLAGGCFWCLEAEFQRIEGVIRVVPGYTGGKTARPTYEQVCTGKTGHAESVQVFFDPSVISYKELLEVFFTIHDPTQMNRQGADVGTQYRSAIFYHNEGQKAAAEEAIEQLDRDKTWKHPVVTQVVPAGDFYAAEDYHVDYYNQHPAQPYCMAVISPKLAKLQQKFASRLKLAERK
jgi:peptide-methionine (S)-S-oxide reductase